MEFLKLNLMKKVSFFLFVMTITLSFSQKGNLYNKENSKLPEDEIWSICVDAKSSKFLGMSKSGIAKFNELNFKIYDQNNSIISGEYISPIFADSNNNVWAFMNNPDVLLKYSNKSWEKIKSSLLKGSLVDIFEDKKSNIYICFLNKVIVFNGVSWSRINTPKIKFNYRCISIGANGEIAIGHNNGLLLKKNDKWIELNEKNSELQSSVLSLFYDNENKLYIGYGGDVKGGLSIYNEEKWIHYNKGNSNLSDNLIRDIEIDDDGSLWLATNHGLNKFKDGKFKPFIFREKSSVITDISIEGNIVWAATHFGLVRFEEN